MRTKNLNLKKKIAFIASVAMIASTAAYLPAEVTKDIFTSSITANAEVSTAVYEAGTTNHVYTAVTDDELDTLNAYIKIDGKYLGYDANNGYKLVTTNNDSTYKPVLAFKAAGDLVQAAADNASPLDDIGVSTDAAPATNRNDGNGHDTDTRAAGDYMVKTVGNAIEIPYFPDAKTVTLEFAALKGTKLSERSITSIDIDLDDRGIGRLGKQHDYVVGMTDDSTFNEIKGDFKDTDNDGVTDSAGQYEVVDLSKLVVAMTGQNKGAAATGVTMESIDDTNGSALSVNVDGTDAIANVTVTDKTDGNIATAETGRIIPNTGLATPIDSDELKPDSYPLMRVNGHFARVIKITSDAEMQPGDTLEVTTGKLSAWSETGSKQGKVTITMGGNADYPDYAVSGLVTHTNGSKKEYFVYVVKNATLAGMDEANGGGKLSDKLTLVKTDVDVNDNLAIDDTAKTKVLYDADTTTTNANKPVYAIDTRYRIEKDVVRETVNSTDYNVTQYTIYNNETKNEYKKTQKYVIHYANGGNSLGTYAQVKTVLADNGTARIVDSTKVCYKADGTATTTDGDAVSKEKSGNTTIQPTGGATAGLDIILDKTSAGCAESEVIQLQDANGNNGYVKFVFTNEYEMKVHHDWEDAKTDLTKDYDEKVEVTGQKVTKPDKIDRLGFDFKGWVIDTNRDGEHQVGETTDIFRTDDWSQQYHDSGNTITPNVGLVANYDGLRCDVVLDANGGRITNEGTVNVTTKGSQTSPEYIHGYSTKQFTKSSFFSLQRKTSNADLAYRTTAKADKPGFKFIGWSTDKDATKKMSQEELEAAFPGADKTLTLYAVYEADDNISVNFKQVLFNENGVTLDTDGKVNKYDATPANVTNKVTDEFSSNSNAVNAAGQKFVEAAKFKNSPSITVTAGQPIGELPVPYEKGYDFDGWYAKTWNNTMTSVEYIKVDKNTVVDEKLFAEQDINFGAYVDDGTNYDDTQITLYAKFVQKTFNITFDIGDAVWESSKIAKPDGKLPATMTYSGYRGNTTEAQKLGFRRPDGEVISVDTWREVANPTMGSGEVNEFTKWTINGKGSYDSLDSVATALTKLSTLDDVVIKAVFEDTESSKSKIFLNANDGDFYQYLQADKNTVTKAVKNYVVTDKDIIKAVKDHNDLNMAGNTVGTQYENLWKIAYTTKTANNKIVSCAPYIETNIDGTSGGVNANPTPEQAAAAIAAHESQYVAGTDDVLLSLDSFQNAGLDLAGGSAGIKVSSKWIIDGKNIEEAGSAADAKGYTVARAGYDFTGWYTDKECTKKYTFDKYPAKGTETILYAGWEKNNAARYTLLFDLFDGDKSEVTTAKADAGANGMRYQKTYMGTIEDIAYAKNLKVKVQDGEGTQSTWKTYVFDPELSKNLNDTSKEIKCTYSTIGLAKGLFEQAEPYTTIYGRFVEEGYQSEEKLTAPTNVKVVNGVVTWVGNDTAVSYQIKKIVGDKVSYGAKVTGTTATIKNIPEEDYQVAVVAYDKNGKTATSTAVDVIVAPSTLEAPKNVKVSDTGEVTWDAAKGAVKYQVLKVVGNTKAYTAKTTELSAQLKSTASDYKVYVIAFDSNGKSKRSEVVEGKAFTNGLGIVKDAKYAADTKTVTWTAVDNAVKYQVLKVVNGKKFYGPYVTGTSYTFKKVPDGAFAYYVIAKDANGNSTRGTMNKVTNHPSVTDVKLADDNKTVTFKAVEGATGYQLCKIAPGKNPAYSAISTNTTITFKNACTSGTQVYVLAFFDEAHKDASYSETIIVK